MFIKISLIIKTKFINDNKLINRIITNKLI